MSLRAFKFSTLDTLHMKENCTYIDSWWALLARASVNVKQAVQVGITNHLLARGEWWINFQQ